MYDLESERRSERKTDTILSEVLPEIQFDAKEGDDETLEWAWMAFCRHNHDLHRLYGGRQRPQRNPGRPDRDTGTLSPPDRHRPSLLSHLLPPSLLSSIPPALLPGLSRLTLSPLLSERGVALPLQPDGLALIRNRNHPHSLFCDDHQTLKVWNQVYE